MEGTTNELVKLFRERLKYPIITVYGIILIIHNWDVLSIFLFSGKNIEARVAYINIKFSGDYYPRILWPLFKAILVSIVAPLIMWGLEFLLKVVSSERQNIRDERNKKVLLGKLDNAKLEFEIEEEKSGKKSLEELNNKIAGLENELEITKIGNKEVLDTHVQTINTLERQINEKNNLIREFLEQSSNLEVEIEDLKLSIERSISTLKHELTYTYGDALIGKIVSFFKTYESSSYTPTKILSFLNNNSEPVTSSNIESILEQFSQFSLISWNQEGNYEINYLGDLFFKYYDIA